MCPEACWAWPAALPSSSAGSSSSAPSAAAWRSPCRSPWAWAPSTGGWALVVARKAASAGRLRVQAGAEALSGRLGVVRHWEEPAGQVFVDGALWRARRDADEDLEALHEGDPVVVERVNGLTLCVRRADEWELIA